MAEGRQPFQWFTRPAGIVPAVAGLAALLALSLLQSAPAQAQRRGFFDSLFGSFPTAPPRVHRDVRSAPADFSKAPPPRKADTPPTSKILVLGDSMADWLAYGLEEAFSDLPEIGVVRKNRAFSGLIRYEARADAPDWTQVAREAIAAENPKFIVIMIGLYDRQPIREAAEPVQDQPSSDPEKRDRPANAAPERNARPRPGATHEYRSEPWIALYTKRIDAMLATLKARGVLVFWVGLPPVRGARSTSDMLFLNELFRGRAEKAGVTFIDVWDGFVDENGRFSVQGPDVEGQIRRLRTADGVHFTKFGARKLAHYVEREIRRAIQTGPVAVALPTSEPVPQAPTARPSGPTPRPLSGPVMPLTSGANLPDEELLGGPETEDKPGHVTATRVLVKGESVAVPAGRSDDFKWPRRSIAPFGSDPAVASTTLPIPVMQPPPAKTVMAPTVDTPAVVPARRHAVPSRPREPPPPRRAPAPFPFFFGLFR